MCDNGHIKGVKGVKGEWRGARFRTLLKALHCPTRWRIIEYIGEDTRSTKEIQRYFGSRGGINTSCLYYHLSELKKAGILEVAGYLDEGGGAPEKLWKLKSRQIVIDLLDGGMDE